jgi:hypothetical protein
MASLTRDDVQKWLWIKFYDPQKPVASKNRSTFLRVGKKYLSWESHEFQKHPSYSIIIHHIPSYSIIFHHPKLSFWWLDFHWMFFFRSSCSNFCHFLWDHLHHLPSKVRRWCQVRLGKNKAHTLGWSQLTIPHEFTSWKTSIIFTSWMKTHLSPA